MHPHFYRIGNFSYPIRTLREKAHLRGAKRSAEMREDYEQGRTGRKKENGL